MTTSEYPKKGRWKPGPVPTRAEQTALLRTTPKLKAGQRPQTWFLNVDWPVHQQALLEEVKKLRPAPRTKKAVLHSSPMCKMFVPPQRIQHAMRTFKQEEHQIALGRLRLFRKLHKAWRCRRRTTKIRGLSLHEQPPQASTDLLKRYVETEDFPWAVGRGSFRQTMHGCMCGVRSDQGLPIYKGWRFESDCRATIHAMNGHECTRDHPHHVTSLNYRSVSATLCCDVANARNVGELEDYPPYLGSLLMAATSVRPS